MSIRNELLESLEDAVAPKTGAITFQPYTELNSKLGTQYETTFFLPALAAGASTDLAIEVGDQPMIIKAIQIQFTSARISNRAFRDPTYTGGSELPVFNLNDGNPVADDVVILAGVTTTDDGTQISPSINSLGSTDQNPNNSQTDIGQNNGVERILSINTNYVFRITNEDAVNATLISGIATWYQGPITNI